MKKNNEIIANQKATPSSFSTSLACQIVGLWESSSHPRVHDQLALKNPSRSKTEYADKIMNEILTKPPPHVLAHDAFPVGPTASQPPQITLFADPAPFFIPSLLRPFLGSGYSVQSAQ
jgi:hypothetical protein